MFCDRCGKLIDDARNFCNGCGAALKKGADQTKSVLSSLTSALISVVVVGLGVLVALMAILLDRVDRIEPVMAFAFFYLVTLFGISFMIGRQISKVIDAKVINSNTTPDVPVAPPPPVHLASAPVTAQLDEYRTPVSVIENTTRTLDKVPR